MKRELKKVHLLLKDYQSLRTPVKQILENIYEFLRFGKKNLNMLCSIKIREGNFS